MSVILDDQTLTLNTVVTIPFGTFPPKDVGWVVFTNASPFALRATVGSKAVPIPAWYYYPVEVDGKLTSGVSVNPYAQTIPGTVSTKTLSTTLYDLYEEPNSPIPQPLGGGPIDLTTASLVTNTNSAPDTVVVYGIPTGDTAATGPTRIENSGKIFLGDATYRGLLQVLGGGGGSGFGIISLDNLLNNPDPGMEIVDNTGNNLNLQGPTSIALKISGATKVGLNSNASPAVDLSGSTVTTAIQLPAGSISRLVTVGATTIANAGTSVAHTLGAVPTFVIPVHDEGAASADVIGVNFGTMTSTHFTAYSSNAAGTNNVRFLVYGA